ncbi:Major facilitator superfamily [Dillenia turbinata]|uniref:Major facilitator superfamily n=1 Tax=Dillenia turbinata TaxID=194707 RepID=A0AAN8ZUY0_9MAGN
MTSQLKSNLRSTHDFKLKGWVVSKFLDIAPVPGGWAAQRIGGRRVLLISFVLWSLVCAFVPPDPNQVMLLVLARLLVGVAQGFIFPSIHTVLAQWVPPHERSRSVSLTTSGMYLGAAVGMLVLPSLVKFGGPRSVFFAEAALGTIWSLLWFRYASDPPRSDHPKAASAGFGESLLPIKGGRSSRLENRGNPAKTAQIPWKRIIFSLPVWAIVILSLTKTRKFLNTVGFVVASFALMVLPRFRSLSGAIFSSSVALGFLALGRAGFAVNHMDIAPRYAGIVMGVSNTAGTLAGIIGVDLTGRLLEAARSTHLDLSSPESWKLF